MPENNFKKHDFVNMWHTRGKGRNEVPHYGAKKVGDDGLKQARREVDSKGKRVNPVLKNPVGEWDEPQSAKKLKMEAGSAPSGTNTYNPKSGLGPRMKGLDYNRPGTSGPPPRGGKGMDYKKPVIQKPLSRPLSNLDDPPKKLQRRKDGSWGAC